MITEVEGVLGVVGDLVEDVVLWLAEPLRPATDTAVTLRRTRGGSGANVAAIAAGLVPTRFLGCVGRDGAGDALVADLQRAGVDVRVQRAGTTGAVVVLVDPGGERSMLPDRAASALLEDVEPSWLEGLAHLHVPAYSFERGPTAATAPRLLASVRDRGGTTSVDASSTGLIAAHGPQRMRALIARLAPTFLLANAAEAEMLGVGPGGAPLGPATTVVVKDGAAPTTVLAPGREPLAVPVAPVVAVRDSTGAGDAFAAGFLAAHLRGAAAGEACEAGHAAAAPVLTVAGAGSGSGAGAGPDPGRSGP